MSFTADLSDQTIDSWLRRHQPRTELAMRYSMRTQFDTAKDSAPFNARIDELFAVVHPSEEEYAEILRRARALGSALGKILNGQRDHQPQ